MNESKPLSRGRSSVLVQWLACACICLVVAAILWPVHAGSGAAKTIIQLSDIKHIGLSLVMYASDYDDRLPPSISSNEDLRTYGLPYVKSTAVFQSINPSGGQFLGNSVLAGRKMGDIVDPAATVMVYDSRPWNGHATVCYADSSAKRGASFDTMLQQLTVDPFDPSQHPGRKGPAHA